MNAASTLRGELRVGEPMSRHTSWRVGGSADQFYQPADLPDLVEFLRQLPPSESLLWVGLGSNLLIRDGGVRGTAISLHGVLDAIEAHDDGSLRVEAGVHCARLAKFCSEKNLGGASFFIGIPGTVGGALAMNAGAYGGETWDFVQSVEVVDRAGNLQRLDASEFEVGYRSVKLPTPDLWFVAATMLFAGEPDEDGALQRLLADRRASQPVGRPSCGSVFRNPDGDHAARLIEDCGLKGFCIGEACVSEKHANFILNAGAARAADIEALIAHIRQVVLDKHGIDLHPEVRVVGEPS